MDADGAARQLLDSVVRLDFRALRANLGDGATLRALLPDGCIAVDGADAVAARIAGWFADVESHEVLEAGASPVGDRSSVTYRLRVRRGGAEAEIEQHMIVTASGSLVDAIDLVCSGYRPTVTAKGGEVRDFDAGTLGCADGLAAHFRDRIKEVSVGDLLCVHTIDPSAKEDLPSLARMMGHAVRSVEAHSDGSLTITVERGR